MIWQRVKKIELLKDENLNLQEEVYYLKEEKSKLETKVSILEARNYCVEEELHVLYPIKERLSKDTGLLFNNHNVNVILLDEGVSRLRDNPDFEIFMKYLHARCESSFKQMHKGNKDSYDYWKGRIDETDEIISAINYGIKVGADKQRKELDRERRKKDNG